MFELGIGFEKIKRKKNEKWICFEKEKDSERVDELIESWGKFVNDLIDLIY